MMRTGRIVPILLVVAAAIFIGFAASTFVGGAKSVRGQVVVVESASVTTISSLTLEDSSGKKWVLKGTGAFTGFTPSHLEEHRALREAITVEYEESDSGELTILGIAD